LTGTLPAQPTEVEVEVVETADKVAVPDLVAVISGEIGAVVVPTEEEEVVVVDMGGRQDTVVLMVAAAAAAMVVVRVRVLGTELNSG
jgi:hypothetical protein